MTQSRGVGLDKVDVRQAGGGNRLSGLSEHALGDVDADHPTGWAYGASSGECCEPGSYGPLSVIGAGSCGNRSMSQGQLGPHWPCELARRPNS